MPDEYQFPDDEVVRKIAEIPATTIKGLSIKAKAYAHSAAIVDNKNLSISIPKEHWTADEQILHSLLNDLIALGDFPKRLMRRDSLNSNHDEFPTTKRIAANTRASPALVSRKPCSLCARHFLISRMGERFASSNQKEH
jgi:hypothetical protein